MEKKEKAKIQEERIAEKLGINEVVGSGATPFFKGDNIGDYIFIEAKIKMKESKSIKVKKEWLEKAKDQAESMRRNNYAVAISFGDSKDYFIVEDEFMIGLYNSLEVVNNILEDVGDLKENILDDEEEKIIKKFLRKYL
ncbi:MAG: hypothetical protein AWU54_403 [Candidatus Frackibacter sp. T328-2]|nr:MAG: hypothetical protein AWU54_403 [Candidatus Frackibacter sp. T328-2]